MIANEIHIEANGEIWVESEGSSVMERSYFDDDSDYYNEEDYEASNNKDHINRKRSDSDKSFMLESLHENDSVHTDSKKNF